MVTPPLGVVGVAGVPGATGQQRRIAAAGQRLLAAQAGAAAVNQVSGVVGVVGSKRARMASSLDQPADGSLLTANAVGAGPTNTVIKQERTGPGGAVETGVDTVNYDANALAGATAGTFAQVNKFQISHNFPIYNECQIRLSVRVTWF